MKELKDLVKEEIHFDFYRGNELFYKTDSGFQFRVPISDTGDGVFKRDDKGLYFMRYIRKELETINESKNKKIT